jgi:hypothetical protein
VCSFYLIGRRRVRSFNELKKRWDDHVGRGRYHPGLTIEDAGVLGADTILVRMSETRCGAKALAIEADRERLLSLLGVSYWDKVPPGIVKNIESASEQWRRGEKALAHIHLAFARLPRLESTNDAYRLYLAEALLDDGLPPREMLAELGLHRAIRQLDKFDPDQPRVAAGSGRESGQWTKDGSIASTSADEDAKVQLAGDVVYLGRLTSSMTFDGPGGIPKTMCFYDSAIGMFTWTFLGTGDCPRMRRKP